MTLYCIRDAATGSWYGSNTVQVQYFQNHAPAAWSGYQMVYYNTTTNFSDGSITYSAPSYNSGGWSTCSQAVNWYAISGYYAGTLSQNELISNYGSQISNLPASSTGYVCSYVNAYGTCTGWQVNTASASSGGSGSMSSLSATDYADALGLGVTVIGTFFLVGVSAGAVRKLLEIFAKEG